MVIRVKLSFSSLSSAVKYFKKMMSPYRCGDMASMAMKEPYYTFLSNDKALTDFNIRHKGHIKGTRVNFKSEVQNAKL